MSIQIPEGFTAWSGGDNPAPGKTVERLFRDGQRSPGPADYCDWLHGGNYERTEGEDIIAYRVIS